MGHHSRLPATKSMVNMKVLRLIVIFTALTFAVSCAETSKSSCPKDTNSLPETQNWLAVIDNNCNESLCSDAIERTSEKLHETTFILTARGGVFPKDFVLKNEISRNHKFPIAHQFFVQGGPCIVNQVERKVFIVLNSPKTNDLYDVDFRLARIQENGTWKTSGPSNFRYAGNLTPDELADRIVHTATTLTYK